MKQKLMHTFLDTYYITLSELAKRCKVDESIILSLQNAQCIPGHTYTVRQMSIFTCAGIDKALTENTALTTTFYYHSSVANWAMAALLANKNMSLVDTGAQIKINFAEQLKTALGNIRTPGCQSFDQAWAYWIDGTWGKCLKDISVACLAKKELARQKIAEAMTYDPHTITNKAKDELTSAVNNYIAASLDFDVYGMRHLLAEEAITKFQLPIKIDKRYFADDKLTAFC